MRREGAKAGTHRGRGAGLTVALQRSRTPLEPSLATFPQICPWTVEQFLDDDGWSDAMVLRTNRIWRFVCQLPNICPVRKRAVVH
jgi:hypothetical protein